MEASADAAAARQTPAKDAAAVKLALVGLAGASIEWYDYFLYATAAALVFPKVFFPATMPASIALIASFSTFAVGFLARPIGAVFFGHMGDRLGRKFTFAVALITMGSATTLIAFLPSYRSAGILAPLALAVLRLTQGFAVGGQWGGAILLATESAPKSKRGLFGSIAQAGVPVGVVLANLAFLAANAAMPSEAFLSYGWRIPFLLSIALVALGLFIHFRVEDTAAFRQLQRSKAAVPQSAAAQVRARSPVMEALHLHPRLILVAAGAYMSTNLSFYILITYVVAYGTSVAGLQLPRSTMLSSVLIAYAIYAPALVLSGMLSDRFGRRRVFMTGAALIGIWTFAVFPLIETRSLLWITFAISVGVLWQALTYGPLAAMFAEFFDTRLRYSAASIAYQTGAIAGGGLAPMIAATLYARFHSNFWVSVYIAAVCAVSLLCALKLKEPRRIEFVEDAEPGVAAANT